MGRKDAITKDYMKNPVIFADAFNKYLYHGKQIVNPEKLCELDTAEVVVPYGRGGMGIPQQRYRDVLKLLMTDGNVAYCMLGVENQSDIHYALPVKNGLYDFMQLARQVTEMGILHRNKLDSSLRGEFLSGFYKTDKLLPVITLTIFFGSDEWSGPLSLREMYSEADELLLQYAPDYRVNLIAPSQIPDEEFNEFRSSLREVMIFNKYAGNKEKLSEIMKTDTNFCKLDRQAAEVINITTNANLNFDKGQGEVNMCLALDEMRKESERRGRLEQLFELVDDGDITVEKAAKKADMSVTEFLGLKEAATTLVQ